MSNRGWLGGWCLGAAVLVTACGGGGSSGAGGGTPPAAGPIQPPATLVEDVLPSGTRIDVSARNLFPLGLNDTWTYKRLDASNQPIGTLTQQVTQANGTSRTVQEVSSDSAIATTTAYTKTAQGITETVMDPTLPASVLNIIGPLAEYLEPLYPVGGTRAVRRAGSFGLDLNDDGVAEGFRFEYSQVFRGFETLAFGGKNVEVAHFSNTTTLTLTSSNPRDPAVTVAGTEEAYFAPAFGLVRSVTQVRDGAGQVLQPMTTLLLDTASVGGLSWADFLATQGQLRAVEVAHAALVYAPLHNSYLASIPNQSPDANAPPLANASSIAVINATTGDVRYVAFPGTSPAALALAADGNSVYAAFNSVTSGGTSTVRRLGLPALNDMGSVTLPQPFPIFPPDRADSIAASPVEPGTFAVSFVLPAAAGDGVALFRNMTLQPRRPTTTDVGSLVFGPDGTTLFAFNGRTSELGLRRFAVLADGLAESQVATQAAGFGEELGRVGERLVLGNRIYGQDLSVASTLSGVRCFAGRGSVLCQAIGTTGTPPQGAQRIATYDPVTLAPGATAGYGASTTVQQRTRYVQGPAGQVAISVRDEVLGLARRVLLFDSALLP